MGTPLRKVLNRISGLASSCGRKTAPGGQVRRFFHRDVEQEEFQYASARCLSSYYSVFVVRLAIMVSLFSDCPFLFRLTLQPQIICRWFLLFLSLSGHASYFNWAVDSSNLAFYKDVHNKITKHLSFRSSLWTSSASDLTNVGHLKFYLRNNNCTGPVVTVCYQAVQQAYHSGRTSWGWPLMYTYFLVSQLCFSFFFGWFVAVS